MSKDQQNQQSIDPERYLHSEDLAVDEETAKDVTGGRIKMHEPAVRLADPAQKRA